MIEPTEEQKIMTDPTLKAALDASPSDRRLTPERVEAAVKGTEFYVVRGSCLTICVITMRNGFSVAASAACADPANFDPEIGRTVSYNNALKQVWPLEGYLLKQRVFEEDTA